LTEHESRVVIYFWRETSRGRITPVQTPPTHVAPAAHSSLQPSYKRSRNWRRGRGGEAPGVGVTGHTVTCVIFASRRRSRSFSGKTVDSKFKTNGPHLADRRNSWFRQEPLNLPLLTNPSGILIEFWCDLVGLCDGGFVLLLANRRRLRFLNRGGCCGLCQLRLRSTQNDKLVKVPTGFFTNVSCIVEYLAGFVFDI
jgi:hypothetical protein